MDLKTGLIRDEGKKATAYRDTRNILTIGCGRNIETVGLHDDEIDLMLENDIKEKTSQVLQMIPFSKDLDEARFGVLVNMAFMGIHKVLEFQVMLTAMQRGDWEAAAVALLDSAYARQVGSRAQRLAEQLRTGVWT